MNGRKKEAKNAPKNTVLKTLNEPFNCVCSLSHHFRLKNFFGAWVIVATEHIMWGEVMCMSYIHLVLLSGKKTQLKLQLATFQSLAHFSFKKFSHTKNILEISSKGCQSEECFELEICWRNYHNFAAWFKSRF